MNDDSIGELALRPIKKLPVKTLNSRLVDSQLRLAGGKLVWGVLGNVKVNNPKLSEHFVTVSVFHESKWFTMARYHDFDSGENGPEALAKFLGLGVRDVFPISFDLKGISQGDPASLKSTIEREPRKRLTRAEIIALAVP